MTTRVQKGAVVFRPAKSRARSVIQQTSTEPNLSLSATTSHVISFESPFSESSSSNSEVVNPHIPLVVLASPRPTPEPSTSSDPRPIQPPSAVQSSKKRKEVEPVAAEGGSLSAEVEPITRSSRKPSQGTHRPKSKEKPKTIDTEDDEPSSLEDDGSPAKKRRKMKNRVKKKIAFDSNADPGEELDPTTVTMATLCDDTGQGRVSSKAAEVNSNFATWRAQGKIRRAEERVRQERRKYGLVEEETPAENAEPMVPVPTTNDTLNTEANDPDAFDYTQEMTPDLLVAKVRTGPNGETIIDADSLVIERDAGEPSTEGYTHVVESDTSKFSNSATYSKRFRGSRWSAEETELFYNALSQYGENYELISYVLPGRDRKACRNKFKAEDKRNHARINYCLKNTLPVDMETLSRMTGKDFSGPIPEIKIPELVVKPPIAPTEEATQSAGPSLSKPKKRGSRKSSAAAEEGVVILGNVDGYDELA